MTHEQAQHSIADQPEEPGAERAQTITPACAAPWLQAHTTNRPLPRPAVRGAAEPRRRGDRLVIHQGIAFAMNGVVVDRRHRLAAVIEADQPVKMTVFTDVPEGTFLTRSTQKRRFSLSVSRRTRRCR